MGPAARDAVPVLIEALRDDYRDLGTAVGPELPVLIHLSVLETLGSMGPAAAHAVPALVTFLKSEKKVTRRALPAAVILKIESTNEDALDVFMELLRHERPDIRAGAAEALGTLKPTAADLIPALEKLLDDKDPNVRAAAAKALESLQQ
jgi:HEAT repeat protein